MESFHDELTDKLMDTIVNLKTKKDCYDFFEDVCTIKEILEILDMSKRLEAAKLLNSGLGYKEVMDKVKLSSATLSRVSKSLNYGTGGYKKVISESKK